MPQQQKSAFRRFIAIGALAGLSVTLASLFVVVRADDAETLDVEAQQTESPQFGFGALELFKLDRRSGGMLHADVNHDGRTDIVIVDNSHSRIDVMLQRGDKEDAKKDETADQIAGDVNAIKNDWRFEHVKVSVDREIASMALGDFDGDQRNDIAYIGKPDRLVVRYQSEDGNWKRRSTRRLAEISPGKWILASGDLNSDGRSDLAVLGKNVIYVLYQGADGKLQSPLELMNTSAKLSLIQIADLDGDGIQDLCYAAHDGNERSLAVRFQDAEGQLGPEMQFELNRPRSITLADIDGKPGKEVLTIDARTGRVKVSRVTRPKAETGTVANRLIHYGLGDRGKRVDRDLTLGDMNGDGLVDVVVTDPDAAQMIYFQQRAGRGLDVGKAFPGLVGADQLKAVDIDKDGSSELLVLSSKEKTLGLSRLEKGRLSFPRPLTVEGVPIVFETADLNGDGKLEIVYVANASKTRRDTHYQLRGLSLDKDGAWKPYKFADQTELKLPTMKSPGPGRFIQYNINNDSHPDFILFLKGKTSQPPLLFVGDENGGLKQVPDSSRGVLGEITTEAIFVGASDNPGLFVAQRNFARNVHLVSEEGRFGWQVVDQYNATDSKAQIAGAAVLDFDGEAGNEIVLIDTGVRRLRILKEKDQLFQPWSEVEMGSLAFKSSHVADLNNDKRPDLLLLGRSRFAVLYAGQTDPQLAEVAVFESKLKKIFFSDVVAGDLNGDNQPELVAVDTRSHYVEVMKFSAKTGLKRALHFKVFEEKGFSANEGSGTEPREAALVDVTGDGRSDLILLAHDRILLYPQQMAD